MPKTKKDLLNALEKHKQRFDKVNKTTNLILREITHFEDNKSQSETIDILEISSLLLILIIQAQSHENHIENVTKDSNKIISNRKYSENELQDILSIKKVPLKVLPLISIFRNPKCLSSCFATNGACSCIS